MSDNLFQITALSFEKYMLLNQWSRDYKFKNKNLMVFISPKGKRIAIPANENYDDFYFSLERMLKNLEDYLGKSSKEIVKEIMTSYFDRLEFRIQSEFTVDGKLPLGYAAECIDGLKDLVLYSACAEEKIQPICYKATNKSREITNKFKLAQTEVGSFVINIDTEVVEENGEQETLQCTKIETPIEHKIVERIYTAINQINDVVTERNDINNVISSAFETGLTANMCDALLKLKTNEVQIDATIRYASAITRKPGELNKVVLKDEHFYVMKEISERYREIIKSEDVTLHGLVEEMRKDRVHDNDHKEIVLVTIMQGKYKRIKMELSQEDYEIANNAHMNDKEIEISGELDMTNPRKWVLDNPRNLKVF